MKKEKTKVSVILMSLIELIIAVLLLIDPMGFTSGIIRVIGAVLAIMGLVQIVQYFRTEAEEASKKGDLAKGILLSVFGIFCLFRAQWFIATFPVMTMLYGIAILVTGVTKLQNSVDMIRTKKKYWFLALISALLALGFSVLIICNPFASTIFLWNFIGISLIVEAVMDILTFIFAKKS